ncbi:hypothetical protein IQ06DRAFT_327232 [Phaeosphaeriaceae sp. SRC1lsM3a]|nr:hypothetical protein IQ06DRAFT_327232 [Stagonospora sp. SRC1lsM3a]
MRASVFYSAAFAAVASAQSSSVDPFPQTSLLAQTDSRGVVTGMFPVATSQPQQPAAVTNQPGQPAVVTSQPAVVTTQPAPANIPAVGSGITTLVLQGTGSAFNQTRTVVVSANNSTTVELVRSTPASGSGAGATGSGASGSGSRPSGSASGTGSPASTGAASPLQIASGSLIGFGAIFAAFL